MNFLQSRGDEDDEEDDEDDEPSDRLFGEKRARLKREEYDPDV